MGTVIDVYSLGQPFREFHIQEASSEFSLSFLYKANISRYFATLHGNKDAENFNYFPLCININESPSGAPLKHGFLEAKISDPKKISLQYKKVNFKITLVPFINECTGAPY
jgi:hypothetical protein